MAIKMWRDGEGYFFGNDADGEKVFLHGVGYFRKVREELPSEDYMQFLKCFFSYSKKKIEKGQFEIALENILSKYDPQLMAGFKDLMKECYKSFGKVESEEQIITPSYRTLVGKDSHHKSEVLNDCCVCVSSRGEDQSWKGRQQDQYEQMKIKLEDDRHELDMLMMWLKSGSKYAEELCKGTKETELGGISRTHFLRCLERLYGDYGLDIIEFWKANPVSVAAVVFVRLKQKIDKLAQFKAEIEKIWAQQSIEISSNE